MRVCVIVDNPLTYDRRVLRQVRSLRGAGHEVTVVAYEDPQGRDVPDLAGAGLVTVTSFGGLGVTSLVRGDEAPPDTAASSMSSVARIRQSLAGVFTYLSKQFGTRRYLRRGFYLGRAAVPLRPDICHANNLDSLPAALACKALTRSKVVYDAHEMEGYRAGWPALASWRARVVERVCIRYADRVIAASDTRAAYLAGRYGIQPPTVIRNVAETPRLDAVGSTRHRHDELTTVLYLGGIAAGRGLEGLIDSLDGLPRVRALLVGPDVGLAADLAHRAARLDVSDRVVIRPAVPPDELGNVLQDADVGYSGTENVSLNNYYTAPNRVFHYLSYGLPVVASDLPEHRALLGSGAGVLFEPGSRQSLIEAIETVLEGDRAGFGARALAVANENSWEREQERLLQLYEQLGTM